MPASTTIDSTSAESSIPDLVLEVFGQQGSAGVHTPFLFCYDTVEPVNIERITTSLEQGLCRLSESFPWVAGNIINEGKTLESSGIFKIRTTRLRPDLVIKDYRRDERVATWSTLQESRFKMDHLDEELYSPISVIPNSTDVDRSPVLTVQLSILRGGLIVAIDGHHQALDGTGQEIVCYLLNKACRGEEFTEEEVGTGNLDRATIIELLPDSWQPQPSSPYLPKAAPASKTAIDSSPPSSSPQSPLQWASFSFSADSLKRLKQEALASVKSGFVSTNDALTAIIWQALARARLDRFPQSTTSTMARAINPRRYLPEVPEFYPGYISNMAFSVAELGQLVDQSLGSIAHTLRSAVDPDTSGLEQATREYATLMYRAKDRDSISMTQNLKLDTDIMLSSWASMRCYHFDFGLGLGTPVAFRRTKHVAVPGLLFLLPQDLKGEIVLTMCVREDELEKLRHDETLTKFVEHIG